MSLVEAIWSKDEEGSLLLWAERKVTEKNAEADLTNDKDYYPYSLTTEELTNCLTALEIDEVRLKEVDLYFPVSQAKVINRNFLNQSEVSDKKLFKLNAASFDALDAINILTSINEDEEREIKLSDSFLFWREVSKLVLELLAKGQYLPGISRKNNKYYSLWNVLLHDEVYKEKFETLAKEIPNICLSTTHNSANDTHDAKELVFSFISRTGESLLRSFLSRYQRFEDLKFETVNPKHATAKNWFLSLAGNNTEVSGSGFDLLKLEQKLKAWSGKYYHYSGDTFHPQTTFRLHSPRGESNNYWILEFGLRAKGENDNFVSVEELWETNFNLPQFSEYTQDELENFFLKDLGKACRIIPGLQEGLREPFPSKAYLTSEQSYDFLKIGMSELEKLEMAVEIPGWWGKSRSKVGIKLKVDSGVEQNSQNMPSMFFGTSQLLDFSWKLVVGDKELTQEDFERFMSEKSPLQQINGEWVEIEPKKLEATLKFISQLENRKKLSLFEALNLGFMHDAGEDILPVVGVSADGWIKQLFESTQEQIVNLDIPKNFHGELRPYQHSGVNWLTSRSALGIGCCLADDMGLGKTVQFLCFVLHQKETFVKDEDKKLDPYLLIVPMSILTNWEQESKRFTPNLKVYLHHGQQRLSGNTFIQKVQESDVVVTTYSLAYRDEDMFQKCQWSGIVLDEAQNIKNVETKQSQAIRRLCHNNLYNSDKLLPFTRFALTGTPLENHLEEIWSIFDFLNPGLLGNLNQFRTRFAIPIERYRDKDRSEALSRILSPFVLRRLKTDPKIASDLPEKIEMEVMVPLTPEQASLYQAALDEMLPQVEIATGMHRKGLVLSTITKLKQICNHPTLFLKDGSSLGGRSHKLTRVEQLLEELSAEGDKALLFTQFAQFGHLLQPYLQEKIGKDVLFFHGGLTQKERAKIIETFQQKSGPPLLILSLKAGGFGLNLTEANQVIHIDQWWNPAVETQATDRAFRIGQKRNVQVRKLICQGTLEEKISAMQKHKLELVEKIMGETKNEITQLSTDELKRLLELSSSFDENE